MVGVSVGVRIDDNKKKKKGNRNFSIPLVFLVAGPGFEAGTLGL